MKPTLQLKIGQQLTMTPQLQQAIRLLQLSTLELQQEVQEALESNPMLEEGPEELSGAEQTKEGTNEEANTSSQSDEIIDFAANSENVTASAGEADTSSETSVELDSNESIPDDLPVDSAWEDVYQSSAPASSGPASDEDYNFDEKNTEEDSLIDHLLWQLNLTPLSDRDKAIGGAIIEAIDTKGYLSIEVAELVETLNHGNTSDDPMDIVEEDEIEAVLKFIQQFDPPGVAARDLKECLLLQLKQLPEDTEWRPQAEMVISGYIDMLGSRDYAQIMRKTKLKEPELKEVIHLVQTLSPYPGEMVDTGNPQYVIPDVIVRKDKDRWTVELNPDAAPKIRINSGYASLIQRADSSSDNTFLRNNLQEAKWFIKSLQSRNETLLKVATKIVEYQRGFFDYGEEAMKPLVLHDIAEAVEMHESTISRVTTQKYMHTPKGIFELKYFFSSHVSTTSGGECSSTAIRAIIKKLVAAEDPKKPLSDSKIAGLLADQEIKVARRTIAKYRESLMIPPSNERKRLV